MPLIMTAIKILRIMKAVNSANNTKKKDAQGKVPSAGLAMPMAQLAKVISRKSVNRESGSVTNQFGKAPPKRFMACTEAA